MGIRRQRNARTVSSLTTTDVDDDIRVGELGQGLTLVR
jgi:hypothetical protein